MCSNCVCIQNGQIDCSTFFTWSTRSKILCWQLFMQTTAIFHIHHYIDWGNSLFYFVTWAFQIIFVFSLAFFHITHSQVVKSPQLVLFLLTVFSFTVQIKGMKFGGSSFTWCYMQGNSICHWITFVNKLFIRWIHLIFNLMVQMLVGLPLEMVHGSLRIGTVYMAGVLAGI